MAEFVWTTWEIWSTPAVIWVIASVCFSDAIAISFTKFAVSSTFFTIIFNEAAVSLVKFSPLVTADKEFPIITVIFFTASPDCSARFLTSSATTAKPLPASPALAASIAAFKAKRFVWEAISSIVLIIAEICFEEMVISFIESNNFCILVLPSSTICLVVLEKLLAFSAFSVFFLTWSSISVKLAKSSSTAPAWSVDPSESICVVKDNCSEPLEIEAIDWFILKNIVFKESIIFLSEFCIGVKSPIYSIDVFKFISKSPFAKVSKVLVMSLT